LVSLKNMLTNEQIDAFFAEFENAFSSLDTKKSAEAYADTFISAGPKGTIAQGKQDLINKSEQAAAFYRSVGQKRAEIISKQQMPITDEYLMVTVHWGVYFEKNGDTPVEFDVTYVIQENSGQPKIILFITHQDEQEAMQKLGLIQNQA